MSRRFHSLAEDSELWKRKYYSRWVWPRARRIQRPASSDRVSGKPSSSLRPEYSYTPKASQWLDHGHLAHRVPLPHWKQQYQLRHNWSTGACKVTEVEVLEKPDTNMHHLLSDTKSGVQIKICGSFIFTADYEHGLRAWRNIDSMNCVSNVSLEQDREEATSSSTIPTAISAVIHSPEAKDYSIVIGFMSGRIDIFNFNVNTDRFERVLSHEVGKCAISTLALSLSHMAVFTEDYNLLLFRLSPGIDTHIQGDGTHETQRLRLLTKLSTQSISQPVSLSIRTSLAGTIASIGYTVPRLGGGWSVGIQELRLNEAARRLESRVATTAELASNPNTSNTSAEAPTSLSYSHPYLVTSHSDNTLTVYLVKSTSDSLSIKTGRRLWGHTSSVRGVEVSDRGKAVSVSVRGDDVRIWELEEAVSLPNGSKAALQREGSIRVMGAEESQGEDAVIERPRVSEWIGFDEEQVVVLFGRELGAHYLKRYSFT